MTWWHARALAGPPGMLPVAEGRTSQEWPLLIGEPDGQRAGVGSRGRRCSRMWGPKAHVPGPMWGPKAHVPGPMWGPKAHVPGSHVGSEGSRPRSHVGSEGS